MSAAAPLPDAPATNWVDRYAPPGLRPWLRLGRFDRPAGTWLLLLPGWQALALGPAIHGRLPSLLLIALFGIGAAAMRGAGCAYNDIVDRDLDAKVARTAMRPIPSGQIRVRQAWLYLAGLCLAGLGVLLTMNRLAIGLGIGSLVLIAVYPFMKRVTWWPQAWLGLTFNWGALLGFAAATGTLAWPAALLYAGGWFWTLGYDTIYAIQDLEDDALAGVKSSARRLGAAAPRAVLAFYLFAAVLALAAGWSAHLGPLFYPVWLTYTAHLLWQAGRVRVDDPVRALFLFKANRDAGLLLFAAFILGAWRP
ncbi:MAG TPA: 4-hydroxybenzoate octaprenyltransferase [Caulobacteraceae bacterium]|jgi:4-hydroxybenzoate polyprenyltransferase|nr:4-hydroxybenzoate octaprenyltransferase [Caulobacteraceae bacterium]